jgi:hypothetical protein
LCKFKSGKKIMEELRKILYVSKYSHEINGMGPIKKIGKTIDIVGRMKKLTIGPVKTVTVATYIGESTLIDKFERDLHNTFTEYRVEGEWFRDDDNIIVDFIDHQVKKLKKFGLDIKKLN